MNVTEIDVQSGHITQREWTPEERARKEARAAAEPDAVGHNKRKARLDKLDKLLDLIEADPTILDRLKVK